MFRATIFSDQRIRLLEEFIINNIYVKYFKKEQIFKTKIEGKYFSYFIASEVCYIKQSFVTLLY